MISGVFSSLNDFVFMGETQSTAGFWNPVGYGILTSKSMQFENAKPWNLNTLFYH